jgi:hypothetical protein
MEALRELLDSSDSPRYVPPPCLNRSDLKSTPPPAKRPNCGGFFDVASAQRRLSELDSLMAGETFWNNRDQAQKLIDEATTLRKKIDPLISAEKQLDDFRVMTELAEAEPIDQQAKHEQDLARDLARFGKELDLLELKVLLNGPHDKNNCILSINAGAGGTEAQDWAEMLSRMYTRWAEGRGWEVEVEDALPGEGSPPNTPSREYPASSAPPPGRRAGPVERSTLMRSGMKMPTRSVRLVVGATSAIKTSALINPASSGVSEYFWNKVASVVGLVRL